MRFELQVRLGGHVFHYALGLELPDRFKELRVRDELLKVIWRVRPGSAWTGTWWR
jgi:hypothetical protein